VQQPIRVMVSEMLDSTLDACVTAPDFILAITAHRNNPVVLNVDLDWAVISTDAAETGVSGQMFSILTVAMRLLPGQQPVVTRKCRPTKRCRPVSRALLRAAPFVTIRSRVSTR
jgi:hypothetical protein